MSRTRPITRQQYRQLVRSLPEPSALAVMISADTGLRVSDVLALKSGDVARTMHVTERKTGKRRTVHLRPATLRAAEQYRHHGQAQLIPVAPCTIYRQIKRAAAELGLEHVSMHSLRKLYAREYCRSHGLAATQHELQHDYLSTTLMYVLDPDTLDALTGGQQNVSDRPQQRHTE